MTSCDDDLCLDKRDGIARIAFNRPARRNALGDGTTRQLVQVCEGLAADSDVRVVVITGEGEAFCAGGDFEDTFERGAGKTADEWAERIRQGPSRLARVLREMPQPVVACVNGVAVGGGATIALACDLRIASDRARFAFPFADIGITPEFGCSHLLQRVVGLGHATALLMLGETIDASTAHRIGLVHQVVAHEALGEATATLVARLAGKPPGALRALKSLLHRGMANDLPAQLELEAETLGRAFTSDEHRRAVAGFLERRARRRQGTTRP